MSEHQENKIEICKIKKERGTKLARDEVVELLKANGCRITKQRLTILDIILEDECSCCKEIYYKAAKLDDKIGTATVYRMVSTLEDIGVVTRKICLN